MTDTLRYVWDARCGSLVRKSVNVCATDKEKAYVPVPFWTGPSSITSRIVGMPPSAMTSLVISTSWGRVN